MALTGSTNAELTPKPVAARTPVSALQSSPKVLNLCVTCHAKQGLPVQRIIFQQFMVALCRSAETSWFLPGILVVIFGNDLTGKGTNLGILGFREVGQGNAR